MTLKIIRTESDYDEALERISTLMDLDLALGSPEGDELDLLCLVVEHYEDEMFPMKLPSPLYAIQFRMEQQGLKPKDLVPYIGSASKVSEVLSGKRSLSLAMIRRLVAGLGIPAKVLLQEVPKPVEPVGKSRRTWIRQNASAKDDLTLTVPGRR